MANNRHVDSCEWGCRKRHWTARNIRLKLTWKLWAITRLRFKLWRWLGVDLP